MTSKPLGLATALCALLALAGPSQAETLADAMAKAYANHPGLAAQRAALRGLDEAEYQARAQAYGTVNLQADYGWQNADTRRSLAGSRSRDDVDPFDLGLQGSIPIYSGGQIENSSDAALQAVRSGRSTLTSAEQNVLLAAVTAFEDVRRDIALVEVARSNVRVIGEQLKAAQDRFEVGEVTRTDVAQAESRLAASRSTLAAIVGQLARSRQSYLAAVGESAQDLENPPPLPPLPESELAAQALAEAQHPDLVAARFDARQAEAQVKVAIGRQLPQVSVNGAAGYSDDSVFIDDVASATDSNAVSVGVTASMPLWTGGRNASDVRQAQSTFPPADPSRADRLRRRARGGDPGRAHHARRAGRRAGAGLGPRRSDLGPARRVCGGLQPAGLGRGADGDPSGPRRDALRSRRLPDRGDERGSLRLPQGRRDPLGHAVSSVSRWSAGRVR